MDVGRVFCPRCRCGCWQCWECLLWWGGLAPWCFWSRSLGPWPFACSSPPFRSTTLSQRQTNHKLARNSWCGTQRRLCIEFRLEEVLQELQPIDSRDQKPWKMQWSQCYEWRTCKQAIEVRTSQLKEWWKLQVYVDYQPACTWRVALPHAEKCRWCEWAHANGSIPDPAIIATCSSNR